MTGYTPIYNLPYPQASDLVSAYPGTGQDLAEEVETVLAAKAPSSTIGLTLITSAALSAVASVSVNGCFTSTYAHYRIVFGGTGNTAATAYSFRLRASGADNTSSTYYASRMVVGTSTGTFTSDLTSSFTSLSNGSTTDGLSIIADFVNPQAAAKTAVTANMARENIAYFGGIFNATTQFDGFSLIASAGTLTGTVRVYGYKD